MTLRDTIDEGLTAALTEYGTARGLPRLHWHLCSGVEISSVGRAQVIGQASVADYPEQDVAAAVQAWAAALQFQLVEQPGNVGALEARGVVEGLDVEVWGVTDREAFERRPSTEQR